MAALLSPRQRFTSTRPATSVAASPFGHDRVDAGLYFSQGRSAFTNPLTEILSPRAPNWAFNQPNSPQLAPFDPPHRRSDKRDSSDSSRSAYLAPHSGPGPGAYSPRKMTRGGEDDIRQKVAAHPAVWEVKPGTGPASWAASPSSMAATQWRVLQLGDGSFLPCPAPHLSSPSPRLQVGHKGAVLLREAQLASDAKRYGAQTARTMKEERASGTPRKKLIPAFPGSHYPPDRSQLTTPNAWWHLPRGDHSKPPTRYAGGAGEALRS